MPTQPPASGSQKELLTGFATLAQTDATSTGNQIAILDDQITRFTDGKNLFVDRYNFWDGYISPFGTERRYLDGVYQTNPLVQQDYDDFLNHTGRLFGPDTTVVRIAEFDGGGATTVDPANEQAQLPNEAPIRTLLVNGFTTTGFPSGLTTQGPITPSSTTVDVQNSGQTQVSIPVGVFVIIETPSAACLARITSVTENQTPILTPNPPGPPIQTGTLYDYTLGLELHTTTFTSVATGASFTTSWAGFTDLERTHKTASILRYQPIMDDLITQYQAALAPWKTALDNQFNAISQQTAENAPDTAYLTAQAQARTDLTDYLTTTDISDLGLAVVTGLVTTRGAAIGPRVTWISNRYVSSTAFDARYKYANQLYNYSDGSIYQLQQIQTQKAQLTVQQAASNARAASLQHEANT